QRAGLVPDRVRDRCAPEIVHEPGPPCPRSLGWRQPRPFARGGRERGDLPGVPGRKRRLEIGEIRDDFERLVQGGAAEYAAGLRLAGERRIPWIELVQSAASWRTGQRCCSPPSTS